VVMVVMVAHSRPTTGRAQAHAWFFHYNKLTVCTAASRSRVRQVRRQHHFLRLRFFTLHLRTNRARYSHARQQYYIWTFVRVIYVSGMDAT